MIYEWDEDKNQANILKHGVGFETAKRVFENRTLTRVDERSDYGEARQVSLGMVDNIAILVVVHTDRGGRVRLISARPANRRERKRYEDALRKGTATQ